MTEKTIEKKIKFLVRKWVDEADEETVVEYAAQQLERFYSTLNEEDVEHMYDSASFPNGPGAWEDRFHADGSRHPFLRDYPRILN
ncbi:MAG TPA: hypothetical protein EYO59_01405 [Chromatiaceae bacterium]|nr:hypothetical protein [Chromatiaceae bacterium]